MTTLLSGILDGVGQMRNWRWLAASRLAAIMRRSPTAASPTPESSMPGSGLPIDERAANAGVRDEPRLADCEAAVMAALLEGFIKY